MKLTSSEFSRCFLYAGSGTDLQPLLRFSHITQTFVYICVGEHIAPATVERSLQEKLDNLNRQYPGALKLEGATHGLQLEDFEHEMPGDWRSYMTVAEMRDYREVFGRFQNDKNWATEFHIDRKVGDLSRRLRVIFLNGEAVASYCALSRNGKNPPLVFCAIQTGCLEKSQGIMNRVFNAHPKRPALWVRGCWRNEFWPAPTAGVLSGTGAFPVRVQGFRSWNSRMGSTAIPREHGGENPYDERCAVAAFAQQPLRLNSAVDLAAGHRSVKLINARFGQADFNGCDAVFAPQYVIDKHSPLFSDPRVIPTDMCNRLHAYKAQQMGPTATLPEVLAQVDAFAGSHPGCSIRVVGSGFEDEASCLREWVRKDGPGCSMLIYAPEPLDYADLRGWSFAEPRHDQN